MPADYTLLEVDVRGPRPRDIDRHNRCWNGKYWCVKVSNLLILRSGAAITQ